MTAQRGYKRARFAKKVESGAKKQVAPSTPQKPPIQSSGKPQKLIDSKFETRNRALTVLGRMRREHLSLSEACRQDHIKPATVRRYVGSAIRQDKPGGRFRPTAGDSLRRDLQIPTVHGPAVISVRGSKKCAIHR